MLTPNQGMKAALQELASRQHVSGLDTGKEGRLVPKLFHLVCDSCFLTKTFYLPSLSGINEVLYFLAGGSWTNVFTEVLQRVPYVFVSLYGLYCLIKLFPRSDCAQRQT
jgi:hypothetical protein